MKKWLWTSIAAITISTLGYVWMQRLASQSGTTSVDIDLPMKNPSLETTPVPKTHEAVQPPEQITKAQAIKTLPLENTARLTPEQAEENVHTVEKAVYAHANELFEQEPIDLEWAPAYEKSLQQMFKEDRGLARVSLSQIYCRTSMCQVIVYTTQGTDADFFTAMFYKALETYKEGTLKSEAAIARNMEMGVTSVYVARKNYTLKFY